MILSRTGKGSTFARARRAFGTSLLVKVKSVSRRGVAGVKLTGIGVIVASTVAGAMWYRSHTALVREIHAATIPYSPTPPGQIPGWTERDEAVYKETLERAADAAPFDRGLAERYDRLVRDESLTTHVRTWVVSTASGRLHKGWPVLPDAVPVFEETFKWLMGHRHPDLRITGFNACMEARILTRNDVLPLAERLVSDSDPMVAWSARQKLERTIELERAHAEHGIRRE